jgi:thiamine-phosphate pyrophosphorylase
MLFTDRGRVRGGDLVAAVAAAARGGLRCVVVREPDLDDSEYRALLERLQQRIATGTQIVVHGRPAVACDLKLGLHLPARAPAIGPRGRRPVPYGRSVHDADELAQALTERVDYAVVGTIFETESKPGHTPSGVALLERLHRQAPTLPLLAIGGVSVSRIPAAIHAGAHGVAVCGALLTAADPERVAQGLLLALNVASGGG